MLNFKGKYFVCFSLVLCMKALKFLCAKSSILSCLDWTRVANSPERE